MLLPIYACVHNYYVLGRGYRIFFFFFYANRKFIILRRALVMSTYTLAVYVFLGTQLPHGRTPEKTLYVCSKNVRRTHYYNLGASTIYDTAR